MAVDVVWRGRKLEEYMTEYVEVGRSRWRWKWAARLFNPIGGRVQRSEGEWFIVECLIEEVA